jgi:hypothetical protein
MKKVDLVQAVDQTVSKNVQTSQKGEKQDGKACETSSESISMKEEYFKR